MCFNLQNDSHPRGFFFLASCRIVCNSHVAVFIKNEKHERMLNGFFVACYEKLFKFIHRAKLCMQRLH